MLRLLGILGLGHLLLGGRRHSRALRGGLLFGLLFGILARNDSDREQMEQGLHEKGRMVREKARDVRRSVRHAVKEAKKEIRNRRRREREQAAADRLETIHAEREARRTERKQILADRLEAIHAEREARRTKEKRMTAPAVQAKPAEPAETPENRAPLSGPERHAGMAAILANVPTLQFPEDDPKYHSARKYGYA